METVEEANDRLNESAQEFVIDKVLRKRFIDNRIEYLIKWIGKEESWEHQEDLSCTDLIEEFEDELKRNHEEIRNRKSEVEPRMEQKFARELEAEQIIGCTDKMGYLKFLVKWKGVDQADLMSAKEAKEKYPKIVQDFYHERLSFHEF